MALVRDLLGLVALLGDFCITSNCLLGGLAGALLVAAMVLVNESVLLQSEAGAAILLGLSQFARFACGIVTLLREMTLALNAALTLERPRTVILVAVAAALMSMLLRVLSAAAATATVTVTVETHDCRTQDGLSKITSLKLVVSRELLVYDHHTCGVIV